MGMNPRLITFIIFMILIIGGMALVKGLRQNSAPELVTLNTLGVGDDRDIRITVELNQQKTLSLFYHVDIQGQTVVKRAFFGTLPRTATPPGFVTYDADQGNLLGIAQASVPNRIIILHDFTSGDSWPMRLVTYKDTDPKHLYPYREEEAPILTRGEALFSRLNEALPESELELLRTMSSRPLTIPPVAKQDQPPMDPIEEP
jgi:hypothetical protein